MLSPPFPNFFGQCPRLSVKGPVQSGNCPFQLLKKTVTLHRATEIIIFVPQIPYNIWQIKTGIRHNIRGSCFSFLQRVHTNTARCLFRSLKRFRGPKPYRNNLARVGLEILQSRISQMMPAAQKMINNRVAIT